MKRPLSLFVVLFLVIGFSAMALAKEPNTSPSIGAMDVSLSAIIPPQPGNILVLDNMYSDGALAVNAIGYTFSIAGPADVASINFDNFDIILVVWWPMQAMVDALNARSSDLEAWISNGGHIVVNAETYGSVTNPYSFLPVPFVVDPDWYDRDGIQIMLPAHCLVANLTDADLDNWGESVHCKITSYPPEADVVSVATLLDNSPHILGMFYDAGTIVVTASDPEFHIAVGAHPGAIQLLANELNYTGTCRVKVSIDIKPGSCPNPFNAKSQGSVPVAIIGTEDFDPVTMVDPATVTLAGVPALLKSPKPVASDCTEPFDGDPAECNECFHEDANLNYDTDGDGTYDAYQGDGIMDLILNFDIQELAAALGARERDECVKLTLEGATFDGTPIIGSDSIVIKTKIKAPKTAPGTHNITSTWGKIKSR